jgi:hypothetical protein
VPDELAYLSERFSEGEISVLEDGWLAHASHGHEHDLRNQMGMAAAEHTSSDSLFHKQPKAAYAVALVRIE